MTRVFPLLLLLGFAAEVASIIWVGRAVGVLLTLLLILAGGVAGLNVIRSAGGSIASALRMRDSDALKDGRLAGGTMLRMVAGVFFIVPGFFSDVLALLLLVPPVQRLLLSRLPIATVGGETGTYSRGFRNRGMTIEAEAIEIEVEAPPLQTPDNKS